MNNKKTVPNSDLPSNLVPADDLPDNTAPESDLPEDLKPKNPIYVERKPLEGGVKKNVFIDSAESALSGAAEIPKAIGKEAYNFIAPKIGEAPVNADEYMNKMIETSDIFKNPFDKSNPIKTLLEIVAHKPETTAGQVSSFAGSFAPYFLVRQPQMAEGKLVASAPKTLKLLDVIKRYSPMLATDSGIGAVAGSTQAANENKDPVTGGVAGAVTSVLTGGAIRGGQSVLDKILPILAGVPKHIIDSATEAGSPVLDELKYLKSGNPIDRLQELFRKKQEPFNNALLNTEEKFGKNVETAKQNLFDTFEGQKQEALNELETTGIKNATNNTYKLTGKAYDNFNKIISGSEAAVQNLKDKYLQLEKQSATSPTQSRFIQQQMEQAKQELASEIWHNVDLRQQMQGKLNKIVDNENNRLLNEKMSIIKQFKLYPDLSESISKMNKAAMDRQYKDFPFAGKVRNISQELTEGVSPQRAQELMDMLDSKSMIDYVKEHPEFEYFAGQIQSAAKTGRASINKMLKKLSDDLTGGEYGSAKDAFSGLMKEEQKTNSMQGIKPGVKGESEEWAKQLSKIRQSLNNPNMSKARENIEQLPGGKEALYQVGKTQDTEKLLKILSDNDPFTPMSKMGAVFKALNWVPRTLTEKQILPKKLAQSEGTYKPSMIMNQIQNISDSLLGKISGTLSPEEDAIKRRINPDGSIPADRLRRERLK